MNGEESVEASLEKISSHHNTRHGLCYLRSIPLLSKVKTGKRCPASASAMGCRLQFASSHGTCLGATPETFQGMHSIQWHSSLIASQNLSWEVASRWRSNLQTGTRYDSHYNSPFYHSPYSLEYCCGTCCFH